MMNADPFQEELSRLSVSNDWLIISLIVITMAFIIIRLVYNRYWRRYRQALFYTQEAQKLIQEKNVLMLQAAISMNVLAVLSIGLFLHILVMKFEILKIIPDNFLGWMITSALVFISFGAKFLFNRFLGKAGDNIKAATQINHHWLINLKNFGFFILPFSAAAAFILPPFDTYLSFAGIAALVFMLIMNYVKGFLILFQHRISIYYGILYLCTLEILPVLIIWKVIRLLMQ